jgi:PBP1b-binding outer membrane lipoprotein LpoB
MNRPFRSFSTAAALLAAALLAGCAAAPDVRYGDPGAHQSLSTDFGASDLQQVAEGMVDSLLTFPAVVDITAQRRPILSVTRVKNKTLQHIDTESITESIRAMLIK